MIKLDLYHGRDTDTEEMGDWGYKGPTLSGIKSIIDTYDCNKRILFACGADALRAHQQTGWTFWDSDMLVMPNSTDGGCILADGKFYGDWTFYIE